MIRRKKKDGATKVKVFTDCEILEQGWNWRFKRLGFQKVRRRKGEIWHSIGGVVQRNSQEREINVEFFPDNRKVLENHSGRSYCF